MLKPSNSSNCSSTTSISSKATKLTLNNFAEDSSNTPQSFWLNTFLRKAAGGLTNCGALSTEKEFKASLVKDLAVAMEAFSVDKFRTDYYFLLIWLSYIKLQL